MRCYASMITDHMISAKSEHYTSMINLLGHAGHLQEAENMIKAMPCKPDVTSWKAFLGACRIHGNVEMGEHVAKWVLELEPASIAGYQASMLLLAVGISVRMLNSRGSKGV